MDNNEDRWPVSSVVLVPSRPVQATAGTYIEWLMIWLILFRDVLFVEQWIGPLETTHILSRLQCTGVTFRWATKALSMQIESYLLQGFH